MNGPIAPGYVESGLRVNYQLAETENQETEILGGYGLRRRRGTEMEWGDWHRALTMILGCGIPQRIMGLLNLGFSLA